MARYIVEKAPTEAILVQIDFTPDLPTSQSVDTVAATATDSSGASAASVIAGVADSNNIGSITLQAGTAGETYQIKFAATLTPTAFVIEHFIEMRVRTFPYNQ